MDGIKRALSDLQLEILDAISKFPAYNSAHEAYGILREEMKEFEDIVFEKQSTRNLNQMRIELIQIVCVAIRASTEVCGNERGRR